MGSCGRLPRRGMSLRLELCLGEDAIQKTTVVWRAVVRLEQHQAAEDGSQKGGL